MALHKSLEVSSSISNANMSRPEERHQPLGNSSRTQRRKSVRFSVLDIREYEVTLGDHPGPSDGPSLSLGWSYNTYDNVNIDFFEKQRTIHGRRKREEMIMPRFEREDLLRDFGYSRKDIVRSLKERSKVLEQRRNSLKMKQWSIIPISMRNRRRSLRRVVGNSAA